MTKQFTVNTTRIDPYKNFKFRVIWDGETVAGVSKVGALKRTTAPVSHRDGNDLSTDRHSPGRTQFDDIVLERGITHNREFEEWANKIYSTQGDGAVSLRDFRKDIQIELLNLQGVTVALYNVYRCWVTQYTALPDLDSNGEGIAFESVTLKCEGWERDDSVVENPES
ncbi:MAG TPA: phage tail protein [Nannocystis exedens]|nr:phage tail protein [Nannocystis exedens]